MSLKPKHSSICTLWDQDGVLLQSHDGILYSYKMAFDRVGEKCPDLTVLQSFLGPPLVGNLERYYGKILGYDGNKLSGAIATTRAAFRQVYDKEGGGLRGSLFPDIKEVLWGLKEAGHRVFLATSKPCEPARDLLIHHGVSDLFDGFFGSERSGLMSAKEEVIFHAMQTHNLVSAHCVMMGDRCHDVLGANRNLVPTIGALWGYGSADELLDYGAATVAMRPRDLTRLIPEVHLCYDVKAFQATL